MYHLRRHGRMIGCVHCPKCCAEVPGSDPECPHCGIIFTKYLEREEPLPRHSPKDRRSLVRLLLGVESSTPMPVAIGRGAFLLLLTSGPPSSC